jgi:hypothetical protein
MGEYTVTSHDSITSRDYDSPQAAVQATLESWWASPTWQRLQGPVLYTMTDWQRLQGPVLYTMTDRHGAPVATMMSRMPEIEEETGTLVGWVMVCWICGDVERYCVTWSQARRIHYVTQLPEGSDFPPVEELTVMGRLAAFAKRIGV